MTLRERENLLFTLSTAGAVSIFLALILIAFVYAIQSIVQGVVRLKNLVKRSFEFNTNFKTKGA
jgi:hypothetical protein